MKIEILYKEVCNLYGDYYNHIYIKKNFQDSTIYETSLNETPHFINEDIDFIYIGSSSEKNQQIIIEKLLPYKERLTELINKNKIILATGNAMEIFGKEIIDKNKTIKCLGIFNYYAKRNMDNRYNYLFLGEFDKIKIIGHKSQFSLIYDINEENGFIKKIRGLGNNFEADYEGFKKNNFYGTYLLGPILVINPYFTKYLMKQLKIKNKLVFEKEAIEAYKYTLNEFENPKTNEKSNH